MNQRMLLFCFLTFFIKLNCVSQDHDYLKRNMEIDQIFSTIVSHEGKYGLVENKSGNTVLPIDYDTVVNHTESQTVYSFKKDDKYGYALLIFDEQMWEYHWEITELIYDTVYFKNFYEWDAYSNYLVKKRNGRYEFLSFDFEVIWNPYRAHRTDKSWCIINYYASKNSYDTLYFSATVDRRDYDTIYRLVYRNNNKIGLQYLHYETNCELPCLWDSVTYDPIKHKDYVWKDGKFAILFIHWTGELGWRLGEANNFVLSTPYAFTNKDEFYIKDLDLGSPVVVVIQHGKPFKIYIDYGSKEINFHYADGSDLIVDTSYFIPEIFRAPHPPGPSHRDGSLYYNDGFRLQVNGARPWTCEYNSSGDGTIRGAMFITDSAGQIIYSFSDTAYGYFLNERSPTDNLVFGKTWNRDGLVYHEIQENYQETFKIFDIKTGEVLWEISEPQTQYYLDDYYYPYNMIRAEYLDKKGIDKEKIVGYIVYNKKGLKVCKYKWISNWFYSDVPVEKP
ncbi:MAG: AhpC/TSA family protein [Crocinitomicaceae bacterium]|nr:AhpC/TSA family protein [Crocinitomicaceae bacterium]